MNYLLKTIKNFFSAPIIEGDENKTFIARILYILLIIILATIVIALFLGFSGKVEISNRSFFNLSAVVGPFAIITLLILLKKGYVNFVAWAFVSFQWFSTNIQVIGSNGLASPALSAFIVTILLAGFLINRKGVVVFGALSLSSIAGIWYLENNNLIPAPVVFTALPAKLLVLLSIMSVATVLLYMEMRMLQKALDKSKAYAAELEHVTSQLETLHEIDRALLSASDVHDIARSALVRIRQLIPCPRASVTLFNLDKKEACFLTADYDEVIEIPDTPITFEEYGQRVIDTLMKNRPWVSNDVLQDTEVTEFDKRLQKENRIQAWLVLPLMARGQLIGALNLGRFAGSPFTDQESDIAFDVANQLAIALQQTRLNDALQNELIERKKLIAELQDRNDELTRFTYTVSHDLRNPLVTIKGFLGMLNRDLQDNRPDRVQSDFQRIAGAADKMDALLTDLLELSRVGRIVNPPVEIDSVRLIQDAIDTVDARIRSRNTNVIIASDLPILYGDRIRLREVFENLIDNAIKYMGDQANSKVEIGTRNRTNEIVFYVKDNGLGIEKKYHERVFRLFEQLNPSIEGTGIGLALVKRIIETHGGKIWVESDGLGKGSTFCFTIPDTRIN